MKTIVRLTESDLHNLIGRTVKRIINERNDNLILQSIAQSIIGRKTIECGLGDNDYEVWLKDGLSAYITYEVDGNPYVKSGMRSHDYDVPDDPDEIMDEPTVEVGSIEICDDEGHSTPIRDNGLVKRALERVIKINYDFDLPSEDDYLNDY